MQSQSNTDTAEATEAKLTIEQQWSEVVETLQSYLEGRRVTLAAGLGSLSLASTGVNKPTHASYEDALAACEAYRAHPDREGPFPAETYAKDTQAFGLLTQFTSGPPTLSDVLERVDNEVASKWMERLESAYASLPPYEGIEGKKELNVHYEKLRALTRRGTKLVHHYDCAVSFLEDEIFQRGLSADTGRDDVNKAIKRWSGIIVNDLTPTIETCESDLLKQQQRSLEEVKDSKNVNSCALREAEWRYNLGFIHRLADYETHLQILTKAEELLTNCTDPISGGDTNSVFQLSHLRKDLAHTRQYISKVLKDDAHNWDWQSALSFEKRYSWLSGTISGKQGGLLKALSRFGGTPTLQVMPSPEFLKKKLDDISCAQAKPADTTFDDAAMAVHRTAEILESISLREKIAAWVPKEGISDERSSIAGMASKEPFRSVDPVFLAECTDLAERAMTTAAQAYLRRIASTNAQAETIVD